MFVTLSTGYYLRYGVVRLRLRSSLNTGNHTDIDHTNTVSVYSNKNVI